MDEFDYKDENVSALIEAIYLGYISIKSLPKKLYQETAKTLNKGVTKGYGGTLLDFKFNSPDYKLLKELQDNIYIFSAAKTATQVDQISSFLYDGKQIRTLSEFKKIALEHFELYNKTYLETEYKTAMGQAHNAVRWNDIQKDKKLFPYLQYKAESGACVICSPFNNITLPVDNSFWGQHMPLNHFGCNCEVMKLDKYDDVHITPKSKVDEVVENAKGLMDPLFKMNPGVDKVIFNKHHAYFEIAKKYPKAAAKNFNLPIPDAKQR